ncbi:hypothetical protein COY90_02675 [Candidatus Roizmanbacteria bacterium CG_4_10_14_0_8_um_filter_39_9]|uniref:HAD family hydrolase n=1 Tax=Candidatus Roizmanbacteria bacterium CG_4_10_14_0_8_um_filter_39_9 TaxID=1974829 RepID=A0A2M7QCT9_9BACT|nr:MAG: hypothetical protein COY90_02675 [Candidatus Roizmanbacteria bacterium CG_4_10_14_0_8_um_filter_39_9]
MRRSSKKQKLDTILSTSNLKHTEALIIGDAPEEVKLGKRAGIITVAIMHGYYSTARLMRADPNYLISCLERLIGIIQKIE